MTEDEVMFARGFVRYGGAWKTPEEVVAIEAELAAKRAARAPKKSDQPEEERKDDEDEEDGYRFAEGFWPSHPAHAPYDLAIRDLAISGFASPFFLFRAPGSPYVPQHQQRPRVPISAVRRMEVRPIGARTLPHP